LSDISEAFFLPAIAKKNARLEDYFSVRQDLTSLASGLVSRIVSKSGPANENIMMVSVLHSGLYSEMESQGDWNGCRNLPLLDSSQLANQTGQNVLDRLAERQMADGGSPWPLSGLPLWMLCADRNEPVAETVRTVLETGAWFRLTFLPPSDGYDGDFPLVSQVTIPGLAILFQVLGAVPNMDHDKDLGYQDLGHFAAQGKLDAKLGDLFRESLGRYQIETRFQKTSYRSVAECFQEVAVHFQSGRHSLPDLLQTYAKVVADWAVKFVSDSQEKWLASKTVESKNTKEDKTESVSGPSRAFQSQWILSGEDSFGGLIANFAAATADFDYLSVSKHGCPNDSLDSVIGATIGFFHIDQLPSSLPWISGCQSPSILGNLTPGSAAHWRKLLLEMSDYRPPVMKLRVAV